MKCPPGTTRHADPIPGIEGPCPTHFCNKYLAWFLWDGLLHDGLTMASSFRELVIEPQNHCQEKLGKTPWFKFYSRFQRNVRILGNYLTFLSHWNSKYVVMQLAVMASLQTYTVHPNKKETRFYQWYIFIATQDLIKLYIYFIIKGIFSSFIYFCNLFHNIKINRTYNDNKIIDRYTI